MKLSDYSKRLSWLLRHGAQEAGLQMDAAGWCETDEVLRYLRLAPEVLQQVVEENNKSRYELRGPRIRAAQGHSYTGMPVTREALEASWAPWTDEKPIWHGTSVEAAESIARMGILSGGRTHVHLAEHTDSNVGKRAGVAVLLEVLPGRLREAGFGVFRSPNGVLLAREVPPWCVGHVEGCTAKGRAEAERLERLFAAARENI